MYIISDLPEAVGDKTSPLSYSSANLKALI
jgi:hypothetical protein